MSSKQVYLCLFFSSVTLALAVWYRLDSGADKGEPKLTDIYVMKSHVDIGKITDRDTAFGEFYIKNIGEHGLYVSKVEVSCTCSSITMLNHEVAVGDSLLILAKLERNTPGYFYSDVIVHGNFKGSPRFLSFEGNYVK